MVVGILRLTLVISGARSLKDKRRALHKLVDRARSHFNVSAAEVGDNELWQKAQLGFAVVSNDRLFVNEVLDKITRDVERMAVAEIVQRDVEIESYSSMHSAPGKPTLDEGGTGRASEGGREGTGVRGTESAREGVKAPAATGSVEADWLVLDDLSDERGDKR